MDVEKKAWKFERYRFLVENWSEFGNLG